MTLYFPHGITYLAESLASIERIQVSYCKPPEVAFFERSEKKRHRGGKASNPQRPKETGVCMSVCLAMQARTAVKLNRI